MFGFRPCAPCCRGVCPDAGSVVVPGVSWCRECPGAGVLPEAGGEHLLGVLRRWRAARGGGFAAPLGCDFLRYISDFLRYISLPVFWIIVDNLLPLGMI